MNSRHAATRAQQRGIPPLVDQLLDLYGQEEHDGHGAVVARRRFVWNPTVRMPTGSPLLRGVETGEIR